MGQKRGHYVPAFLLRRFAHPDRTRGVRVCRLDRESGRTNMADPKTEAQAKHMYRIVDDEGNVCMDAEDTLTTLEDKTAPILRKLEQPGVQLSADERSVLGLFVAMQRIRVPAGREWLKQLDERLAIALAEQELEATGTSEAVDYQGLNDRQRVELLDLVRSDGLIVESPPDRQTALMFLPWEETARVLVDQCEWAVVRAPEGSEFVCSDNPVVHSDRTLESPDGGLGFASSAYAMTTMPVDPKFCFVITPAGRPVWLDGEASPRLVEEINVSTYAWAIRAIYGRNQKVVTDLRHLVKRNRHRLARYPRVDPRA
jgi:hypothetical protein